ncbi:MAG: ribonuclease Z [Calditerrivibrio sp.]|nr:ribonuclease Z [Calditerrivibrio sp.]
MKHNYIIKRVNSPFDDTAFFVRNIYKKDAILFDCGRLGELTNSEMLDVRDIFISHTHIDHFYGFDRILRSTLRSEKPIRFYGPPNFIKNVMGKLASYTWNLIKSYPLVLEAYELSPDGIKKALFSASDGFNPVFYENVSNKELLSDRFEFEYEFFDHKTISVGYRIKEPIHVNIKKGVLEEMGLKAGPWLTQLKDKLLKGEREGEIRIDEKIFSIKFLEEKLVMYSEPQDITFITDIAPNYENFKRAIKFAEKSYILLIESMFMKSDIIHAIDKNHLTIPLAKEIFWQSGSKFVKFFHFAPKYESCKDIFFQELEEGIKEKII